MNKIKYTILLIFTTITLNGQDISLTNLSLKEAIRYAKENSSDYKLQKIKMQESEASLSKAKLNYIPNIYASGDIRYNLIIPSTPVPAFIINPQASQDDVAYMKFNTKWNILFGVNLSYDLFNPDREAGLFDKKHQNKIDRYSIMLSEKELQTKVAIAYAECLIAQKQEEVMLSDTAYYSQYFDNALSMYQKGKITLVEKNTIQNAYNESIVRFIKAKQILSEAKSNILYLIGGEISENAINKLTLKEDFDEMYPAINDIFENTEQNILEKQQEEVISQAKSNTGKAKLKYAPTITLNGHLGTNNYNNKFKNIFDSESWLGSSYIGVGIRLPITEVFLTSNKVLSYNLKQKAAIEKQNNLKREKNKKLLNQQSLIEVSLQEYSFAKDNLERAKENFKAAEKQYEKGYISEQQMLLERFNMQNSFQVLMQAMYNLLVNRINMENLK